MIIVIVLLLVCRLYTLQTNRLCLAAKIWTPKIAFKKVPEIPGFRAVRTIIMIESDSLILLSDLSDYQELATSSPGHFYLALEVGAPPPKPGKRALWTRLRSL